MMSNSIQTPITEKIEAKVDLQVDEIIEKNFHLKQRDFVADHLCWAMESELNFSTPIQLELIDE